MPKKFNSELAVTVHAEFNALKLKKEFETRGRKAQYMLDTAVMRDTDPYVPMDTGELARSPQTASPPGSGRIVYNRPYVARLYYGKKFNFSPSHHKLAQAEWFEASKAVNGKRWIAEVERILRRGNGI